VTSGAVPPTQHRERQDHLPIVGLLVVAAQQVGHLPDEPGDLGELVEPAGLGCRSIGHGGRYLALQQGRQRRLGPVENAVDGAGCPPLAATSGNAQSIEVHSDAGVTHPFTAAMSCSSLAMWAGVICSNRNGSHQHLQRPLSVPHLFGNHPSDAAPWIWRVAGPAWH